MWNDQKIHKILSKICFWDFDKPTSSILPVWRLQASPIFLFQILRSRVRYLGTRQQAQVVDRHVLHGVALAVEPAEKPGVCGSLSGGRDISEIERPIGFVLG